jgi:hypothetical protein
MDVLALRTPTALQITANLVSVLPLVPTLPLLMVANQLGSTPQAASVLETKSASQTSVSNKPVSLTALPNWAQPRPTVVLASLAPTADQAPVKDVALSSALLLVSIATLSASSLTNASAPSTKNAIQTTVSIMHALPTVLATRPMVLTQICATAQ